MFVTVKGFGVVGLALLLALRCGQDTTTVRVGARLVMAAVRNLVGLAAKTRVVLPTSDTAFALKESPADMARSMYRITQHRLTINALAIIM